MTVPAVGRELLDGEGPVGGDGVQHFGAGLLVEEALGYVIVTLRAMAGRPHLALMFTRVVKKTEHRLPWFRIKIHATYMLYLFDRTCR